MRSTPLFEPHYFGVGRTFVLLDSLGSIDSLTGGEGFRTSVKPTSRSDRKNAGHKHPSSSPQSLASRLAIEMASIVIELDYADLPFISDRSARAILKDLSKAVRRAQATEIDEFIRDAGLSRRERQSINDRIRRPIQEAAVYYVEEIRAGSLWGKLTISGFSLWLLSATLGETVKEAWKASEVHNGIIEYVEQRRPDNFARLLENELSDRELLTGRARIVEVEVEEREGQVVLRLVIISDPEAHVEMGRRIGDDDIIEHSRTALARLREEDEGEEGTERGAD